MKKKGFISFLLSIVMIISFSAITVNAKNEEIEVYITVTDITDYTEPFNVLVKRQPLKVSYFNLAEFGDTLTGIEAVKGITYLHALVQLHRNIYGDDKVSENIMLNETGFTKIFMGKSVANIMYKNGRDIFSLPQLINIKDGDEIQVCLYDEGHSQAVATFNEAIIENVSPDEVVSLKLQQHYEHPRVRDNISGAEITTDDGEYLLDEYGDIITTDDEGNFNVSFSENGTYTISIMPTIDYYMDDSGGGIKVEWVPQTTIKEVEYEIEEEIEVPGKDGEIVIAFEWVDDNEELTPISSEAVYKALTGGTTSCTVTRTETRLEEVTELVRVETYIPDAINPMVTYTTPFVTINVTSDLIFEDIYLSGNTLCIDTKNFEYYKNDDLYVAGYIVNDDGSEKMAEVKKSETITDINRAAFSGIYDYYKIFAWEDGTMKPLITAEAYNPNSVTVMSLDYNFSQPLPDNTYITSKEYIPD